MKKVVVVIPVHKPALTQNELASLKQCYNILGSHPIRIVAPEGMDMSVYQNAVPGCEVIFISPEWLSGIQQYNKLKISKYFYDLFKDYEYLLTYELDAWVFRDELLYWCDKGYDFIGAPWFEVSGKSHSNEFRGVGNSGFSLRSIKSCRRILRKIEILKKIRILWYQSKLQSIVRVEILFRRLSFLFSIKDIQAIERLIFDGWHPHEDDNWCIYVTAAFKDFELSNWEDAIKFSFEVNPDLLFRKNNLQLPFGCHAWEKYEVNFWLSQIHL